MVGWLCFGLLLLLGGALPGSAHEQTAQDLQPLEIPFNERIRLPWQGVSQAQADPAEGILLELSNGTLYVRSMRSGEVLLYVWQEEEVQAYLLRVITTPATSVLRAPVRILSPASDQPYGSYSGITHVTPQTTTPLTWNQQWLLNLPLQP